MPVDSLPSDPFGRLSRSDAPATDSRSLALRSGGTLTLSATTKFLSLTAADRKFVLDLLDKFDQYSREPGQEG
jgi:hypothetical protein